jgi:hypothetical protein
MRVLTRLSLAILLLASVARPDQRADRDAFSEAILAMDKDIADAKRNFTKILEPFQDGKPGDRDELQKAYDRFAGSVASALSRASALKAPSTPDCRDLLKTFLDFLAVEQDPVALELKTILAKVDEKDGKLDVLAKIEIIGILNKCGEAEKPPRDRMGEAAREFDRVDKTVK